MSQVANQLKHHLEEAYRELANPKRTSAIIQPLTEADIAIDTWTCPVEKVNPKTGAAQRAMIQVYCFIGPVGDVYVAIGSEEGTSMYIPYPSREFWDDYTQRKVILTQNNVEKYCTTKEEYMKLLRQQEAALRSKYANK